MNSRGLLSIRLTLSAALLALGGTAGQAAPARPPASAETPATPPTPAPIAPQPPQPEALTDFAIFGMGTLTLDSSTKISGGIVGSNGDISIGPFSRFSGLEGGGRLGFSSTGGGSTVTGPITFNGDILLGQDLSVLGAINSGGSIGINDRPHITGSITAAGSVLFSGGQGGVVGSIRAGSDFQVGTFATITGDVLADGDAEVTGTVNGNITSRHEVSVPFPGQVNGRTRVGTGAVTPARFIPETLPPPDTFKVGKGDSQGGSAEDAPLPPGHYGALDAPRSRADYLTAGDYYFDGVSLADSVSLHLVNLSADRGLHVFVKGNVRLGQFVKTFVAGQPLTSANTALAKKVLWEVQGDFSTVGSDEFFGTIFAPTGMITLGSTTTLTGSLIGGGAISGGVFFTQTFVPSGKFANWPPPPAPPVAPPATPTAPDAAQAGDTPPVRPKDAR